MKIDFRELQDGENLFDFDETPEELHLLAEELALEGTIQSHISIYKIGESITGKGETTCLIKPDCARCLDPITIPLQVSYTFVFQKGKAEYQDQEDDETLIYINEEPDEIDLGNEVKDYILLELPMIPTCAALPDGPCEKYDQDPSEILEVEKEERLDPRWDALRALKDQEET